MLTPIAYWNVLSDRMANRNPIVYIIADYGVGDLAFAEVHQRISALIPDATIHNLSADQFSTTHTGFCAYQLALNDQRDFNVRRGFGDSARKTYLFLNTAPRRDDSSPRRDNEGEGLVYARLRSGLEIVGVLSGESFSFVKPLIEEFHVIDVPRCGSQFRSRDIFPEALASIVRGDYSQLGATINKKAIPDPESDRIAHVDGYGNIKLSTQSSQLQDLRAGDNVWITFGGKTLNAIYTDGIFSVKEGELCLAPGSSGPHGNEFLEVSKRFGNAWEEFGRPRVEARMELKTDGIRGRISARS